MNSSKFTARVQLSLIIILGASIVGIGQAFSFEWYQRSLLVLIVCGLGQIAIGNVPPEASVARFLRLLLTFVLVIVAIFAVSIVVTPSLVGLGR